MTPHDPATASWHLDKRVNLSIIFALIAQAAIFAYWVGGVSQRVAHNEAWVAANSPSQARLAVLESQMDDIRDTLNRIEGRLDGTRPIPNSAPFVAPPDYFFDGLFNQYYGPHMP